MNNAKPSKTAIGKNAEDKATDYLLSRGYEILERNFRYKRGEIDLITRHNNTLVIVEVKYRADSRFGYPEQAVSPQKAKMVVETAVAYMQQNNYNGAVRYDILSIEQSPEGLIFTQLKDAFY